MGLFDGVILFWLLIAVIKGYKNGFIKEMASLVSLLIALFVAWTFSKELAPVLQGVIPWPDAVKHGSLSFLPMEEGLAFLLAFLLLFILTKFIVSFFASVLTKLVSVPILSQINGLGGAGVGFVKGVLFLIILTFALTLFPWEPGRNAVQQSTIGPAVMEVIHEAWKKN